MNKTFLFQVNVTRDCNLRCTHCYISTDKKVASKYMGKDQFIEVFEQIKTFLNSDHAKSIGYDFADIHVIGGEPTMLGIDFYQETLPVVKKILDSVGIKHKLSIVSNLLTPESVDIVSLFDQVSTSYEVDTRFVSWKGTPKRSLENMWGNNVKTLQHSGKNVALTMAITRPAIDLGAAEILDRFLDESFTHIHLGFFIPSGDGRINAGQIAPTFSATSKFLIDATDWYLSKRDENISLFVNPIESLIESIYLNKPSDDIICPIIPGALDIDWNGETVTCIEAGGEIDMNSLGNVFDDGISNILNSGKYIRERSRAIRPQKNCIGCSEIDVCQSACGILHKQWTGKGECPGFKRFIEYVRHQVTENKIRPKSIIIEAKNEFRAC